MLDVVLLLLVPFRSQIFDVFFDVFLDLLILPYFNSISMDFYAIKCLFDIYFVHFPCLLLEECLYKRFKCFKNFNEFSMNLFR